MLKCNQYSVIKTDCGTVIAYSLSKYDDSGNLIQSNIRKSYPIKSTDTDISNANNTINSFIENMENS